MNRNQALFGTPCISLYDIYSSFWTPCIYIETLDLSLHSSCGFGTPCISLCILFVLYLESIISLRRVSTFKLAFTCFFDTLHTFE